MIDYFIPRTFYPSADIVLPWNPRVELIPVFRWYAFLSAQARQCNIGIMIDLLILSFI